jgi:phosphatidylethanolamine/phosphatidyl-N-methylethanolamine N-methyltransferase
MAKDIDLSTIRKAYAKWAPIYDSVYSRLLYAGRVEAVKAACAAGQDILEVGCGTGLSLGDYPSHMRVTGVDLSPDMLARAAQKVHSQQLTAITGLAVMDACRLGFADGQFDAVVGQYMITLVPDAEAALDEFARVLKPGGEIILVNHIGASKGLRAAFESAIAPLAKKVGWRTEFPVSRLADWAKARGFDVAMVKPVAPFGFFTLVRMKDARLANMQAEAA